MNELLAIDRDSIPRFLTRWYGEPGGLAVPAPRHLPSVLREWHELNSRWSGVTVHNHPIDPEIEDGKLVFWVENQGGWEWATDSAGDDPPVYDRETSENPGPWVHTGEKLSEFLLHATVFEAVWGAQNAVCANALTLERVNEISDGLIEMPLPSWRWPEVGIRILVGPEVLLELTPVGDVTVAARTSEALSPFTDMPGITWRPRHEVMTGSEPIPDFFR